MVPTLGVFTVILLVVLPTVGGGNVLEQNQTSDYIKYRRAQHTLTVSEFASLTLAFFRLKTDPGPIGYIATQSYHGQPYMCSNRKGDTFVCCIHNLETFPLWHRLMTQQMEYVLQEHGWEHGLPYWDCLRSTDIPEQASAPNAFICYSDDLNDFEEYEVNRLSDEHSRSLKDLKIVDFNLTALNSDGFNESAILDHEFFNQSDSDYPKGCEKGLAIVTPNPWREVYVPFLNYTSLRHAHPKLNPPIPKENTLLDLYLAAFEETNYCEFELHFEVPHNEIHCRIGGTMSNTDVAAFDTVFYSYHCHIERMLVIWEQLQEIRGLPIDGSCAKTGVMETPIGPFNGSFNPNPVTRESVMPFDLLNNSFNATWDTLDVGDISFDDILSLIEERKNRDRIYVAMQIRYYDFLTYAFVNLRIGKEPQVRTINSFICHAVVPPTPWAYERLFKYEITDVVHDLDLDPYNLDLLVYDEFGNSLDQPLVLVRKKGGLEDLVIVTFFPNATYPIKLRVREGTSMYFKLGPGFPEELYDEPIEGLISLTTWFYCQIPTHYLSPYELEVEYALPVGEFFFSVRDRNACQDGMRMSIVVEG